MDRFATAVTGHARAVVIVTLALTAFALTRIVDLRSRELRLVIDSSIESLLPRDSEDRRELARLEEVFGSDDVLLLVVRPRAGVFTSAALERLSRLSEAVESLDGIDQVMSLANMPYIRSEEGVLRTGPLYDEVPRGAEALERIESAARGNPLLASNLLSPDGRATALIVYPLEMSGKEFTASGLDRAILDAGHTWFPDAEVWLTGGPYVHAETTRILLADLLRVVPLAFLLMVLIALFTFRSGRGVLLPAAAIAIALVWTLAIAVEVEPSLNLLTVVVPSLILVVGFAYAIHIVTAYYASAESPDPAGRSPAAAALSRIALATVVTGGTTVAGFGSLMLSALPSVAQFGLFACVGVVASVVVSLFFIPAVLQLLPLRRPRARGSRLDGLLDPLARFDVERRRWVFASGAVLALVAASGMTRIDVNTELVANFRPEAEVRRSFEAIDAAMGGATRLVVALEADEPGAFRSPVNLREIDDLERWLIERPEVGSALSIADYIKTLHRGFQDDDPAAWRIPETRALVDQLLALGGTEGLERLVDSEDRITQIALRARVEGSRDLEILANAIEKRLEALPSGLRGRVTGDSILMARTRNEIALGQALSLSSALGVILLVMILLFTSVRVGAIAMVPNALPVLAYFGILGWSGISLNTTTGLVASMVLGIAVDDTIHFLTRFNREARRLASEPQGARSALVEVGKPMTLTSLALCLGFLVLASSELAQQAQFGVLASVTLALAWLVDMTFTPAIASKLRIVTLWDLLALDLGERPQEVIPLFRGLSSTQARIVALMTEIVDLPRGRRLIASGQKSDGMYLVVEGELEASIEVDGRHIRLNRHARGDVVGEIGLLRGERSANVDCLCDVRLLRFDARSLERLRRRYPRTAARLLLNLSQILAQRLAVVTPRVKEAKT